ncbi:MAG: class I SAM-dependent methyltransferase, partial [Oscillospiraceae bacterium]|nr:class I SAM-dependent methyltransferase [Oscillospiraceae bacterium]
MIKTEWDYSDLAAAYDKRADYSAAAIERIVSEAAITEQSVVCDIGAGTGKLTVPLSAYGCRVYAVEPNDNMRNYGMKNTLGKENVKWSEGTGENTGMESNKFDLVTFGSSFNVCDRSLALKECHRILKDGGYFVCMWNHRVLDDPVQENIEKIFRNNIAEYSHGIRRESQKDIIEKSGYFCEVIECEYKFDVIKSKKDFAEGWYSDATIQ